MADLLVLLTQFNSAGSNVPYHKCTPDCVYETTTSRFQDLRFNKDKIVAAISLRGLIGEYYYQLGKYKAQPIDN